MIVCALCVSVPDDELATIEHDVQWKAAWLSVGMLDPITCLNWIWLVYSQ